jgi:hypothetical protein
LFKKHTFSHRHYLAIKLFLSVIFLSACHNDYSDDAEIDPVALEVSISSPLQPSELVSASYQYRDYGSPEGTSLYQWFLNDVGVSDQLSYLLPVDSEGKTLTFCVIPVPLHSPEKQGEQVCSSVVITGKYVAPYVEDLAIVGEITTGVELSGIYSFVDENNRQEGGSLLLWQVNNEDYSSEQSIILANDTEGNKLRFCVTPIAFSGENVQGEQVCTEENIIGAKAGEAPQVVNVNWDNFAKANTLLTLVYDYGDVDGDAEGISTYQWLLDGVEVSQLSQYTLPNDSSGKSLMLCVTPVALTGLPKVGEKVCQSKDVAGIFVTGELKLKETLLLDIKGYSVLGVTWVIQSPIFSPVRSTSETSFTIEGSYPEEEAYLLVAVDIELCITTEEEGEICLAISEFSTSDVIGGLPVELDTDNNVIKRVISPIDHVDLTIAGVTKRLHRPLTVTESILLNIQSNGAIPLHSSEEVDSGSGLAWGLYTWQNATDNCAARNMLLPVEGVNDTSDAFGLQQYYDLLASLYPQFPVAHVSSALGWSNSGTYHRTSSLNFGNYHYDYYMLLGSSSWIDDDTAEFASCIETLP